MDQLIIYAKLFLWGLHLWPNVCVFCGGSLQESGFEGQYRCSREACEFNH